MGFHKYPIHHLRLWARETLHAELPQLFARRPTGRLRLPCSLRELFDSPPSPLVVEVEQGDGSSSSAEWYLSENNVKWLRRLMLEHPDCRSLMVSYGPDRRILFMPLDSTGNGSLPMPEAGNPADVFGDLQDVLRRDIEKLTRAANFLPHEDQR